MQFQCAVEGRRVLTGTERNFNADFWRNLDLLMWNLMYHMIVIHGSACSKIVMNDVLMYCRS